MSMTDSAVRTVISVCLRRGRRTACASLFAVLLLLCAWGMPARAARTMQVFEAADTALVPTMADTVATVSKVEASLSAPVDTAALLRDNGAVTTAATVRADTAVSVPTQVFVPKPQRALWLALVLPGGGQIYNRKYWKLPIFYGGFLGCTYAFLWNQQMYMDYSQAYLDIMDDDPNTASYRNFFPPGYDIDSRLDQFKSVFKNRKDRFRRYRDLSAFAFIGVYLLSVIDAYVDAQLSVFDISPDLSLRIAPTLLETRSGGMRLPAMGVGATFTF